MKEIELIAEAYGLLGDGFIVESVTNINHKPHPFTIGAKLVTWASKHHGGTLGIEAIHSAEKAGIYCEAPGCRLPYDEHTSDRVMFLQLTRNMTEDEASEALKKLSDLFLAEKIDGIIFVDSPEKYRIK